MSKNGNSHFLEISIESITTPTEGSTVQLNRWWATRNGNPVIYVSGGKKTPQCHSDEHVINYMIKNGLYKDHGVDGKVFVPISYRK